MDLEREKINKKNGFKVILILTFLVVIAVFNLYSNINTLNKDKIEIVEVYGKNYINENGNFGFVIQDLIKINIDNDFIENINNKYYTIVINNLENMIFATNEDELLYTEDIIKEGQILQGNILSADYTTKDNICSILIVDEYIDGLEQYNSTISYNTEIIDFTNCVSLTNTEFINYLKLDLQVILNNIYTINENENLNITDITSETINDYNIFLDDDNVLYLYLDNYEKYELFNLDELVID